MESNIISLTPIHNYLLSQQKDIWSTTQDSHQLHRKKNHFHIAYYKYSFQFEIYLYKNKACLYFLTGMEITATLKKKKNTGKEN